MEDLSRAHVHIHGRVQGVGFRYSTMMEARESGLAGWVRNVGEDEVEAIFEGPRASVDAVIAWCRHGPSMARVTRVDVAWAPPTGERGFAMRPSLG